MYSFAAARSAWSALLEIQVFVSVPVAAVYILTTKSWPVNVAI